MTRPALAALGLATAAEALLFNGAFAALAAQFDYPDILRRPAPEVLEAFAAGGPRLVLTWYAFALSAVLMVPLTLALALHRNAASPLRIAAAILGSLAGTVQAIGLVRWVFAVPALAALPEGQAQAFLVLNQWGGVGIGEHLGYLFTAFFLLAMAAATRAEGARLAPALGTSAALLMLAGSAEGVAMALGRDGEAFGLAAIAGYLAFSLWLVVTGAGLVREALAGRRPGRD